MSKGRDMQILTVAIPASVPGVLRRLGRESQIALHRKVLEAHIARGSPPEVIDGCRWRVVTAMMAQEN